MEKTTLHEELDALYSSPNIIRVIKSRSLRWAEHVARMGKREGKRPLGRHGIDGRIILEWILEMGWGHVLDRSSSGYGQVAGFCECGNEPSTFIKCGDLLASQKGLCSIELWSFSASVTFR
jgi:hypothetical protein